MSGIVSQNVRSMMSSFGVDIELLSSTDPWGELVIDTFDKWSNPTDSGVTLTGNCLCAHEFDIDVSRV